MSQKEQLMGVKDKKIIKELFNDARTPFSLIGREIRLSKEVVNYRVNRLLRLNLLTGFNTVIDVKKMGFEIFFLYLRFRNLDTDAELRIIEYLKNHPNIAWFVRCLGNYDCILKIFVRDYAQISAVSKEIEEALGSNFDSMVLDYVEEETAVPFSFVYGGKNTIQFISTPAKQKIILSKLELQILRRISNNARLSLAELSKSLGASRDVINYHLKKLEKEKIILKYRPDFWPDKLGYNWYFVVLKIGKLSHELESTLKTYIMNQQNVTYLYRTAGMNDLQIEFRIKSTQELNNILMELRQILKTVLKRFEFLMILKEHKYTYFPEALMQLQG